MAYTVQINPGARRALKRLDVPIQRKIGAAIDGLAVNPRPSGVKKLATPEDLWRIRVGDYRVIYQIFDKVLVVVIVTVGHRGNVYR
ncbi:MAG TPA: type II toxin-antitoxin system RelE/ParE family toxin [Planctomycetota bacterium]|nr:type II toxin-antitoxin system RelE/ParE family toxin [Planctomycetota bacterium]